MENELIIRKANSADIPVIRSLAQTIWPVTYKNILSPDQLEYMVELFYSLESLTKQLDRDTFIIAEKDTLAAGFASYSRTNQPDVFKLHKLYVSTEIHGKGLGKSLTAYIIENVAESGGTALVLNVNRFNTARAFYEKLGFTITGEENIDIGNGYQMNDYVMRRAL